MKTINLREFYPFYHSDLFIEVSDEVAEALVEARRYEWRVLRRVAYHRAYFSLDAGDDIERDALFRAMSPCEIYERKLTIEQLYAAIDALPEKQARGIYAHYILGLSMPKIAAAENVSVEAVSSAIERGLKNMEVFLKNAL